MPYLGAGSTLTWNNVVVAGINAINGIELSVGVVDNTTLTSPNGIKESGPDAFVTPGDVSIVGFFEPADGGQTAMLADMYARTVRTAAITFRDNIAVWNFSGFIKSLKIGDTALSGNIPFTATITPSGKPTLAVTASTGMSGLAISNSAVISPTFAIGTFDYVATVLTGIASVTVTPTAAAGVITVNGNTVTSGQASSTIPLGSAGSVTPITIVVTETGKASKTYVIRIVRP